MNYQNNNLINQIQINVNQNNKRKLLKRRNNNQKRKKLQRNKQKLNKKMKLLKLKRIHWTTYQNHLSIHKLSKEKSVTLITN